MNERVFTFVTVHVNHFYFSHDPCAESEGLQELLHWKMPPLVQATGA